MFQKQAADEALEQERYRLLQMQRQLGGGVEGRGDPNKPPILNAARNGDAPRVLACILSGTSPNTTNSEGSTPLGVASVRGCLPTVGFTTNLLPRQSTETH